MSRHRARTRAWRLVPGPVRPGRVERMGGWSIGDRAGGPAWLSTWSRGEPGRDDADHASLLEAVARGLRSGLSMTAAVSESAADEGQRPPGRALRHAVGLLDTGAGLGEVLARWTEDDPGRARQLAGLALGLASEMGGSTARALDASAASLRDRAQLEREVRALGAQARASAWVMVLAPIGFAAFMTSTDHRVAGVLLGSPLGWLCLGVGGLLDLAGAWWMRRLARRLG